MTFKLYNYFRSSASYRVRIALNLKKIDFEYIVIHLLNNGGEQHNPTFANLNHMRQVPSLVIDDLVINQSMAIVDYLDQFQPNPRLFPTERNLRAQVFEFCEIINSGIQPLQNMAVNQRLDSQLKASKEEVKNWNVHWISKGLNSLEQILSRKPEGTFCFGKEVTAADAFLIPQVFASKRFGVDPTQFKRISLIYEHCMSLDAFERASPEKQIDYTPT